MDVTAMEPFSNVICPGCGKHTRVKREFGPYTLLRRHGIGGMSVVFAAHDNTLDREVAVKILNEAYSADARRMEAFEHEARVTASISHPHVVRVFTTGRAFGRFFLAMEMVTGGHFEGIIRERGTVPEEEALRLADQVAGGLRAAHAAGLIHRDIKPGNILLDASGNAKIADFGLALLLDHSGKVKATEMWATPYYVPPETIEGQPEDLRSDVYAFGASFYHALAGKPPCDEERMRTDLLREAKRKVRPLHEVAPWVSDRTCAVVDRAMAWSPEDRFQSYDDLLKHLRAARTDLKANPVDAKQQRSSARERSAALRRKVRNRRNAAIAAGATAALLLLGVLALWLGKGGDPSSDPSAPAHSGHAPPAVDAATSARIAGLYEEARNSLDNWEFARARRHFASLRDDPAVGQPTRSWAAIEAVLMPLLEGAPGEARKEATPSSDYLETSDQEDYAIKHLILPLLRDFSNPKVEKPDAELLTGDSPGRILFWMLAGMKNWENGRPAAALPFFKAVAAAEMAQSESWLQTYPKLAAAHLADAETLSSPLFTQRPTYSGECRATITALEELRPKLQTRGRARFNLLSWKADLEKLSRSLPAAPQAPPPEDPAPPAPETPDPAAVMATVALHAGNCDFPDLTAYLRTLKADPPGIRRASLATLAENAADLLTGLNESLALANPIALSSPGKLKSGEEIRAIGRSAQAGKILAIGDQFRRDCSWANVDPDTVIALHREAVKLDEDPVRRVRRHEAAIAFLWLTGGRTQALETAERLAVGNDSFRERWETIKSGLPKE